MNKQALSQLAPEVNLPPHRSFHNTELVDCELHICGVAVIKKLQVCGQFLYWSRLVKCVKRLVNEGKTARWGKTSRDCGLFYVFTYFTNERI